MLLKKTFISAALTGVVMLALASSGGGKNKKAASSSTPDFAPIRAAATFTLRSGQITGSHIASSEKLQNGIKFNTFMTYERGNTVLIMPYTYKATPQLELRSNLYILDLKINLHK